MKPMTDPVMQVSNLSVVFNEGQANEVVAFKGISFEVGREETVAIVGPSGCGKSTLFNAIAGLLTPTAGEVRVQGKLVEGAHGQVGYMLQKDLLLPWRTVLDNVVLGLEVREKPRADAVATATRLIEAYGLKGFEAAYPSTLSGGMRQRVAFMRTLALNPDVILLDEPFSALDFQTRILLQRDVSRIIREQRKTAILVTHDIGEAVTMADRVIILTARPGRVRRILDIKFGGDKDPVAIRQHPEFNGYFETIWRELDLPKTAASA
jgi:NitT/TauT family transport system ATP-binding protein